MTVDAQAASDLARQVRVGIEAEPFLLGTHSAALAALAALQAQAEAGQRLAYCVLHGWTNPAFGRGKLHNEAAEIARALAAAAPSPADQEEA